jgi:hypothetical protein
VISSNPRGTPGQASGRSRAFLASEARERSAPARSDRGRDEFIGCELSCPAATLLGSAGHFLILRFLWIHRPVNTWDEAKRQATLAERGLDFAEAELLFAGRVMTLPDERRDLS